MITLTDNEVIALNQLFHDFKLMEREDLIGVFMKHGLFHVLKDGELVGLVEKFEPLKPS